MNQLKALPKDNQGKFKRRFTANGKTYLIRSPDEVLTIERKRVFDNMGIVAGLNMTIGEVHQNLLHCEKLANGVVTKENDFVDLVLFLRSMSDGIKESSDKRFDKAMYYCSLFIVTEDEDITTWSIEMAEDKIEDWNKESYKPSDFFLLCADGLMRQWQGNVEFLNHLKEAILSTQSMEDLEESVKK